MNKSQWRKLKCKSCLEWRQGNKDNFPNGFCLIGNSNGAVALEKVKTCHLKTD